jgi:hypothetical protein
MAFYPVTAKLWETENGFNNYDEIGVVSPGFNGGWQVVMYLFRGIVMTVTVL